jgi:hypothetical protein
VCDAKLGCVAGVSTCEDYNVCTIDTCVGEFNCTHVLGKLCDDGNACTVDTCDSNAATEALVCNYTNIACTPPTICQVTAGCDIVTGCVYQPIVCPTSSDWCLVSECVDFAGCINLPKGCVVSDPDCYYGRCDSTSESCIAEQRENWTLITSAIGVAKHVLNYMAQLLPLNQVQYLDQLDIY